jgi:hypothetical protein
MNPQRMTVLVNRGSLVLAPLLLLLSVVAMPTAAAGAGDQIAAIAEHPGRWYAFTLLSLVSSALFVPAVLALRQLAGDRAPLVTLVGVGLFAVGAFVAVADCGTQLVYWQMGRGDRGQMLALAHRYENAAGANAVFLVGGLAFVAGGALLALALVRSRAVPVWAAACLPVGIVVNIVGFASGSRALLVASGVVLTVGLGRAARLTAALRGTRYGTSRTGAEEGECRGGSWTPGTSTRST